MADSPNLYQEHATPGPVAPSAMGQPINPFGDRDLPTGNPEAQAADPGTPPRFHQSTMGEGAERTEMGEGPEA